MVNWTLKIFRDLKNELARLYDTRESSEMIVSSAGISKSVISWRDRATENWYSIMETADKRGQFLDLLGIVNEEYPNNSIVLNVLNHIKRNNSGQPQTHNSTCEQKEKNVISGVELEIEGNATIGDKGITPDENWSKKNVIVGSKIKVGGDFHLGDTIVTGNQNVNFTIYDPGMFVPEAPSIQKVNPALYAKTLLEDNQFEKCLEYLKNTIPNIESQLINLVYNLSGQYNANKNDKMQNIISLEEYRREINRIRSSLFSVVDELSDNNVWQTSEMTKISDKSLDILTPSEKDLERVLGTQEYIYKTSWMQKGLNVAKSVCRVVLPDGKNGTGFILEGGYLLTNHHVLYSQTRIKEAKIEFNYEEDIRGILQNTSTYFLDETDCVLSPLTKYDYVYVKIKDPDNTLSQWGFLEIDDFSVPQIEDAVNIIQHPESGVKQIALTYNWVIGMWQHRLFYRTDTKKGSSGSPVLNAEWKVIALHHAGADEKEGGLVINENGDRMAANEGILIKYIMNDIKLRKGQ